MMCVAVRDFPWSRYGFEHAPGFPVRYRLQSDRLNWFKKYFYFPVIVEFPTVKAGKGANLEPCSNKYIFLN